MRSADFVLPSLSEVKFSISHLEIDGNSPLNQNQSHIHKECEIYLNLSGDVAFEVENHIYPVSRGSVIITRPYEYHHCIYRSARSHEHYWITFSAEQEEKYLTMFFRREKGADNLLILSEEELERVRMVLDALLDNQNDTFQRHIDFLRLIRILSLCKRAEPTDYMQEMAEDVVTALTYMEEHCREDFGIGELAEICGVSVNSLERHFKQELGISPYAMLRRMRLSNSMKYLRAGDPVAQAALKSGFTDYSNYIQMFRKEFGLTPRRYKELYGLK